MRKTIALSVAALGIALVAFSAAFVGTGTAVGFGGTSNPFSGFAYNVIARSAPAVTAPVTMDAVDPPASDPSVLASVSYPPSADEMLAAIPTTWTAEDISNATIGIQQTFLIADCMEEAGYSYVVVPAYMQEPGISYPEWYAGLTETEKVDARLALWGETGSGADYRWEDAGCQGYAVHTTGMDNVH